MRARTPENEAARLQALRSYGLLDTAPEQPFDDITTIASLICQTPIAVMVLMDETRQWFKSKIGVDASETPREHAFCAHTILGTDTLVVPDARNDQRFSDNPMVTAEPHIRFYAGAPLLNPQGFALGTLCVVDLHPRELATPQLLGLQALARQVVAQMELRRVANELAAALEGMRTLQGLLPICAWCKSIRDDDGYWGKVEDYLSQQTGAQMTHGICPACLDKQMEEIKLVGQPRE
jgi:GAF domain-containing protein